MKKRELMWTKQRTTNSSLAKEFGLGHGHSMAIWAVFKDEGRVDKK
jgi:hypothetical protein